MQRAVVVRGKLSDPSHIELDEPLSEIRGAVEVTVRPVQEPAIGSPLTVLQAMRALPDLEPGDVGELEQMIEAGKLPTRTEGLFDAELHTTGRSFPSTRLHSPTPCARTHVSRLTKQAAPLFVAITSEPPAG